MFSAVRPDEGDEFGVPFDFYGDECFCHKVNLAVVYANSNLCEKISKNFFLGAWLFVVGDSSGGFGAPFVGSGTTRAVVYSGLAGADASRELH